MNDTDYMRRAITLAERGRGFVEPNPMVGAVVVRDGTIVGEGWHERFGGPHAEVHALRQAGDAARGATIYVTLEPCCHFGKTPPCTDAIRQSGASRVVAAMLDPFPQVAGQGANRLRSAGIAFEVGTCEAAARQLNAPYLKRLRTGFPWVHAKWAATLDGKIATVAGESKWITGPEARERAHQLRGRMDAIIIGRRTLVADDPLLTARPPGPRIASRVVVTRSGDLPLDAQLLRTMADAPVLVFAGQPTPATSLWSNQGATVIQLPIEPELAINSILAELGKRGATNIMLEGGGELIGQFASAGEIDEVLVFIAPMVVGGLTAPSAVAGPGIASLADAIQISEPIVERLGNDVLITGRCRRPLHEQH